MTIKEMSICNLIQSFPVLLILAQKQNKCLETHFVYHPPSPTQSPEYYHALEALFNNLYGHDNHHDAGHPSYHPAHKPCYVYSKKYGIKPCQSSHNYPDFGSKYPSYYGSNSYGSHSYGSSGYGSPAYGSPGYGYGAGYGALDTPGYKKGNIYNSNLTYGVTYGSGYASAQGYSTSNTRNKYKVVVKKTRIGKRTKKSGKMVVASSESCTAPNGALGLCIELSECAPYQEVFRTRGGSDPVITWMLREAHCGWEGNDPKVCCPIDSTDESNNLIEPISSTSTLRPTTSTLRPTTSTLRPTTSTLRPTTSTLRPTTSTLPPTTSTLPPTTSTLRPTTSTVPPTTSTLQPQTTTVRLTTRIATERINYDLLSQFGSSCTTVYNTTGSCSDVYLCKHLLEVAKQARTNPDAALLLKNSSCGFKNKIPQVCCPLPGQPTELPTSSPPTPPTTTPATTLRKGGHFLTALPEPPVCGLSNVSLDRVVGGIPSKLGAFPWMALLGYRDESIAAGLQWKCGGSLLSNRHVLTAAHCIHGLEDSLFLVRLGELDLARDDEGATPIDVPIREMIKHPQYTKNRPMFCDIGLLVLERDVEYTAIIKPICLPSKKWQSSTFEDFSPFIAGWGRLSYRGPAATQQYVAQVPVIANDECTRIYSSYLTNRTRDLFPDSTMCAGYMQGQIDACEGDSGGPLMQPLPDDTFRSYFYAIGVVSFGRKCAEPGWPGAYARVTYFMPWLEQNLLGHS